MKAITMMMGAMLVMSSAVFAQTKGKHHGQHERGLEKLKSELSLNDDQYASIKGINKKYAAQVSEIRKDTLTKRSDKHKTLNALREKRHDEINSVLTSDQRVKFEALKKERVEKRQAHLKARHEKWEAQMIKDLALTDDQTGKIKTANKAFLEKMMVVRSQTKTETDATKAEIKRLRADHEATVQSILTVEQFSKWKEIRKSANAKFKRKQGKK